MITSRAAVRAALAAATASLAACSSPQQSIVETPMYPPLQSAPLNVNTEGSIYQTSTALLMYETPRAQHIGDVLTIQLSESYTDSDVTDAAANRSSDITADAADKSTKAASSLAKLFNIGSASTEFKGHGNISNTSGMTGELAVTVIGTLPSGNLLVSGEKVIATRGQHERMRLSGVVNPKDIGINNYVPSSKVANARIEQAGVGMLNDATTLGWLQHMFLSVLTY
ncbi:flagellar basal body L-ring protein FlgH [Trinickia terrae]|uniref:Flagellar basal body L-ring protein FlgH n=1 Tax=Trinickia terrae TaxID=2571161 RepID=A0A4U1I7V0_9BURK|nr:flagellar basal body L-ring protein FlgH [Trinickia terrae]TKC89502.1 flagellar basal body L-ring protein FlgH [Trinickia terrae]